MTSVEEMFNQLADRWQAIPPQVRAGLTTALLKHWASEACE